MRFSRLPGLFSHESLTLFLNRAMAGQQSTMPLQEMPSFVEANKENGGSSVDEEMAKEEFDLAEVMGIEVDEGFPDREAQLLRVCP
jgi:hypothetical protein